MLTINQVKKLAEQDKYEEALEGCAVLHKSGMEGEASICRMRAYIYSLKGDYFSALGERRSLISTDSAELKDYYLAGNNALSLGQYSEAKSLLKELLHLADLKGETWFNAATWFLLSYSELLLNEFDNALKSLDHASKWDSNCEVPLPNGRMMNLMQLRDAISAAQAKRFRRG